MANDRMPCQIEPDLYMLRTQPGRGPLTFNSYLLLGDRPTLIHTGNKHTWEDLHRQLTEVLPLAKLAYVVVPHFEADECGALPLLLQEVQPTVVASRAGCGQLMGFGLVSNPTPGKDGDVLDLGGRELELIAAPSEMHLWDGLLAFDRRSRILFSADFLSQMGADAPPIVESPDLAGMAQMATSNIPCTEPYERVVERLRSLTINLVAPGHGSCFTRGIPDLVRGYFGRSL